MSLHLGCGRPAQAQPSQPQVRLAPDLIPPPLQRTNSFIRCLVHTLSVTMPARRHACCIVTAHLRGHSWEGLCNGLSEHKGRVLLSTHAFLECKLPSGLYGSTQKPVNCSKKALTMLLKALEDFMTALRLPTV